MTKKSVNISISLKELTDIVIKAEKCDMWQAAVMAFHEEALRARVKYHDLPSEVYEVVDKIRQEFFECLEEYGVKLYE